MQRSSRAAAAAAAAASSSSDAASGSVDGARKRARPDELSSGGASEAAASSSSRGGGGVIAIREGDDKARPAEEVTQLGYALLDVVLNRIDPDDETLLALPFLELPSRTLYPDYYTTIRRPMCLHDIERRLEKRAYASFGEVRADCETVCGNAKRFNLRDSPIWLKARALHAVVKDTYVDLVKFGRASPSLGGPESPSQTRRVLEKAPGGLAAVRAANAVYESGDEDADAEGEDDEEAEQQQQISTAAQKKAPSSPAAAQQPASDPSSSQKKPFDFNAPRGKLLKNVLKSILKTLLTVKDENGTLLCEFFLELPSRVEYPDYYKVIEQPISIEEIEQKLNSKKYRNPHAMFSDLSLMVDNALRYNEDGSPVHTDAVNLRKYIETGAVPALLRDGFTLDPNDVRQSAIPPDRAAAPAKEGAAAAATSASPAPEPSKMKIKLTRKSTVPDLAAPSPAAAPASSPPIPAAHLSMPPPASTSLRPSASPRMSMRPSASPAHSPAPMSAQPQHRLSSAGAASPPQIHMAGAPMQPQQAQQMHPMPSPQQQQQQQQHQQQHPQQQHAAMAWQASQGAGYFAGEQSRMQIPPFRPNGAPVTPAPRQPVPAGAPQGNYAAYPRPPPQQMPYAHSPVPGASPSMPYAQLPQQQAPFNPAYASPRLQSARPPVPPQPQASAQPSRAPSASPLPGGARPPSFNGAGFATPAGMQQHPARPPGPRRLVGAPPNPLRPALVDGKRAAPSVASLTLEAGTRRWRLDNRETCAHALLLPAGCTQVRLRFRTSPPQASNGETSARTPTVLLNARVVQERSRRAKERADSEEEDSDVEPMDVDEADADGETDAEGEPDPDEEILLAPRAAVKAKDSSYRLQLRRGQNVLELLVPTGGAEERCRVFLTRP